ncbi:MAG TPA: peptidase M50 [Roseiflexaceae bacterium]
MNRLFSVPDEAVFQGRTNDNTELLKAWLGSTLAYAIFFTGARNLLSGFFLTALLIAAIVCGLAFVLHELAHRVVARNYGAEAHFIANNGWLLLSIVIAFAGFFIAAPGAVWHRGYLTKRQGGLIALAGPATNLAIALICFGALFFIHRSTSPLLYLILQAGFRFNAFLGLFNMIPAGPFDGTKVLEWSPLVFGITVAIGLVLTFVL